MADPGTGWGIGHEIGNMYSWYNFHYLLIQDRGAGTGGPCGRNPSASATAGQAPFLVKRKGLKDSIFRTPSLRW